MNVLAFGAAVLDQHLRYAFRDLAFLLRRSSFHPGNLHVRHRFPPVLNVRLTETFAFYLQAGDRQAPAGRVLRSRFDAPRDSTPARTPAHGPTHSGFARGTGSFPEAH